MTNLESKPGGGWIESVADPAAVCPSCKALGSIQTRRLTKGLLNAIGTLYLVAVAGFFLDPANRGIYQFLWVPGALLNLAFTRSGAYGVCVACKRKVALSTRGKWIPAR
jgi:hypothetical protein